MFATLIGVTLSAATPSDEELCRRFLSGDDGAFVTLYRRHAPLLYAFLTRMIGVEAADDVLQDAWMKAARSLPGFQRRSSLRTWLCGIAVNCARAHLRSRRPPSVEVTDAVLPVLWYDAVAAQVDLERAIAGLSPRYREVFLLHDVGELTHAEIATALQIDEGTSKSNLSRARAALREFLHSAVRQE